MHLALYFNHQVRWTQSASQHPRSEGGEVEFPELWVLQHTQAHGWHRHKGGTLLVFDGLHRTVSEGSTDHCSAVFVQCSIVNQSTVPYSTVQCSIGVDKRVK